MSIDSSYEDLIRSLDEIHYAAQQEIDGLEEEIEILKARIRVRERSRDRRAERLIKQHDDLIARAQEVRAASLRVGDVLSISFGSSDPLIAIVADVKTMLSWDSSTRVGVASIRRRPIIRKLSRSGTFGSKIRSLLNAEVEIVAYLNLHENRIERDAAEEIYARHIDDPAHAQMPPEPI